MKYTVIACKTVKAKDGKEWFAPSVVLPDGDVHTFFGRNPYKVGDTLETTTRKMRIGQRDYLVEVL